MKTGEKQPKPISYNKHNVYIRDVNGIITMQVSGIYLNMYISVSKNVPHYTSMVFANLGEAEKAYDEIMELIEGKSE